MFRKHKRWKEPDIEPAPDLNGLESTLYPQASSSETSLSSKCLVKTFSLDSSDIHHSYMNNDDLERNKKSENGDIPKNGAARQQNRQDNKNLSMSHHQEQGVAITSNYPDCIENDQESKNDVDADDMTRTQDKPIDKKGSVPIYKGDIDKLYKECLESSKKCPNKRKDGGRLNFLERATRRLSLSTSRIKKFPEMFESRLDRFPQVLRPSMSLDIVDPLPEKPEQDTQVPARPSRRFSNILKPSRSLNFRLNPTTNFKLDFNNEGSAKRNNHRVESFKITSIHVCKKRMALEWDKRFPDLEKDSEWPNVTEVCYEERGSDGESQPASGASEESCTPVTVVKRDNGTRNQHDISKRLSLPADMRVPYSFLRKQSVSPTLEGPITRTVRRQSLSEIGFGRLNSYIKYEKLGEGSYATVYRGKSVLTNNQVALKVIRLEHEEGAPCTAIREISLLKNLKHHNIVTLHDIIHTDKVLTLVFEYLNNDLKSYLDANYNDMTKKHVQIFLFQLLRGLAYCHKRKVLHRDLKPQNILLNSKGELKLADFGLARAQSVPSKTYSNEVVTLWYRPPDVLLGSKDYSTSIDMWGVGCIFFEMMMNEALFPGHKASYQIEIIFNLLGEPTEETWPGCSAIQKVQEYRRLSKKFAGIAVKLLPEKDLPLTSCFKKLGSVGSDLLKQLLKYDTRARISASDAMNHPYFANLGPEVHSLPDTASIFCAPGISSFKL